jgi:hypothetical protein
MNSAQFNSAEDKFSVLDFTARFEFKTASSISFSLERYSKSLCPTRKIGWMDVHYPCQGHIKVQLRISLPNEYHTPKKLGKIVADVLAATGIPADETYEAVLFAGEEPISIVQSMNREGITDRI